MYMAYDIHIPYQYLVKLKKKNEVCENTLKNRSSDLYFYKNLMIDIKKEVPYCFEALYGKYKE